MGAGIVSLRASGESWLTFRADPALPGLILAYGEEHGVQPEPDWPRMQRMASIKDLRVVTLRAPVLVGFCLCTMHPQLGFKGKVLALADLIFVDPAHRPIGTKLLLQETERCMREHGASHLALHHAPTMDILAPLGAANKMRVWIKEL